MRSSKRLEGRAGVAGGEGKGVEPQPRSGASAFSEQRAGPRKGENKD